MEKQIYWRVTVQHYDFTKVVTCRMSYGFYCRPQDTVVKNTSGSGGWAEIKYFVSKDAAKGYMLEAEDAAG